MAILMARHVTKVYGPQPNQVTVLQDVNLDVQAGEYLGIVGPSGSGKSTLLHLLGGVDLPTSGSILLEGQDLSKLNNDQRAIIRRRRIGFVFQRINLLPNLSAIENVVLPLMIDGVPRTERDDRAAEYLQLVGMSHRLKSFPSTLSGGEQQRVAIARALVTRPAVVLADEPTGALDSANGKKVADLLKQAAAERNQTVVLVTHDLSLAAQTDRQVHVLDGQIASSTVAQANRSAVHDAVERTAP